MVEIANLLHHAVAGKLLHCYYKTAEQIFMGFP